MKKCLLMLVVLTLFILTGCGVADDDSGSARVDEKLKELQSGTSSTSGDAFNLNSEKSLKTITINKDAINMLDLYQDDFKAELETVTEIKEEGDNYILEITDYKDVYSVITNYMSKIVSDTASSHKSTISYNIGSNNINLTYDKEDTETDIERNVNTLIKYFALYQAIEGNDSWTVVVDVMDASGNSNRVSITEYDGFKIQDASATDASEE